MRISTGLAFGLVLMASPALAQSASGGASGAGAAQGGTSAPGSGTGTPGAISTDQTSTGVGTSSTSTQPPAVGGAVGASPIGTTAGTAAKPAVPQQ